jgi:DegV family protein with EDD domain
MSYQIITDSCADLTDVQLKQWDVSCVNLTLRYNGENHGSFSDPAAVKAFYDEIRNGTMATTAAANPEEWAAVMRAALDAGRDVLVITFSSGMSTTYQSAVIASQDLQEEYPDRKIIVVDTLCAALGQGLLVKLACDKRDAGLSIEETAAWVEEHKLNLCHWVTVDDLSHLKRGGRISATTALLGTMLNIKPILRGDEEGHIVVCQKCRGRKKAVDTLAQLYKDRVVKPENQYVAISHGDCLEEAEALAEKIRAIAEPKELIFCPHEPVTGSHVGPGMLAVFFFGEGR